ncbi:MAG: hypothetical protein K2N00_10530, partial [Lachnospiraceae bacterium]|nr:hypothetical protein [Lachnospiraceae bacterium]
EYYEIQANDEIEILGYYTVRQISEFMDVVIDWNMNIYVNNKVADMETKVYENFSVIWTLEELHLSDVEMYEQEQPAQEKKAVEADRPAGTAGFSMLSSQKAEDNAAQEKAVSEDTEAEETPASGEAEQADAEPAEANAEPAAEQEQPEEKKKGARIVMGPGVRRAEEEAKAKARAKEEAAAKAKEEEEKRRAELLSKGVPTSIIVTVNGDQIKLSGKKSYVFVDVFEYIDFDLSKPQGSGIVTRLNDREAEYMETIRSGDVIEIYWKQ